METPKLIDASPFEPIIIKSHFDFDWKELKPVCQKLINTAPMQVSLELGGGKSSVYNDTKPHTMREFKKFYEWLQPIVEHVIVDEWGYTSALKYGPVQSWVNVHDKGGFTDEHAHGATQMVIAAYLNLPEDGGYIEYKDPLEYQKGFHYRPVESDWKWRKVEAKTGDVIMFPGWLIHRTEPSQSPEDRWVLTTNISPIKALGRWY
jgi:uncharacterized protein (TIGR02466 family)